MRSARKQLLQIHKRLVRRIKREIDVSIGALTPELRKYKRTYNAEFRHYHVSTKAELMEAVLASDMVFLGDYHTLRQAQQTLVKLLEEVLPRRLEIVLALEMVRRDDQPVLDEYMSGAISTEEFLEKIDYEHTWGFPWSYYQPIFEKAFEHGLRVVGINSSSEGGAHTLEERDNIAAEIVAREALARPEAMIIVFDGDLHMAGPHLPAKIKEQLRRYGAKRKTLKIFQNNENLYWRLAESHNEQVDVVRLRRDAFCVMNTTPLVKHQSYFNWENNREELTPVVQSDWMLSRDASLDYGEQVHRIVRTIAGFFEIGEEGLEDFTVYTTGDLDFLERLRENGEYTPDEVKDITVQILKNESYFITKGHILYLANLSLDHAAEEATHFINHVCAGSAEEPLEYEADFYYRAMKETIGWLGSKVINLKRTCYKEKDFHDYLNENAGKKLPPYQEEIRRISKYVKQHKAMERRLFRKGARRPTLRRIFGLPISVHIGVTHALGYMLGDKLYFAMMSGDVKKEEIRRLFYEPLHEPGRAFELYMHYAERMESIQERCYSKDVCM